MKNINATHFGGQGHIYTNPVQNFRAVSPTSVFKNFHRQQIGKKDYGAVAWCMEQNQGKCASQQFLKET